MQPEWSVRAGHDSNVIGNVLENGLGALGQPVKLRVDVA